MGGCLLVRAPMLSRMKLTQPPSELNLFWIMHQLRSKVRVNSWMDHQVPLVKDRLVVWPVFFWANSVRNAWHVYGMFEYLHCMTSHTAKWLPHAFTHIGRNALHYVIHHHRHEIKRIKWMSHAYWIISQLQWWWWWWVWRDSDVLPVLRWSGMVGRGSEVFSCYVYGYDCIEFFEWSKLLSHFIFNWFTFKSN